MKKISFILLSLVITLNLTAQNKIDSLSNFIETSNGIEKAEALIELGQSLKRISKDTALLYVEEAYQIAFQKENLEYQIKALNMRASIYQVSGELNAADSLLKISIQLSEDNSYSEGFMETYLVLAKLYTRAAQYKEALEYVKKSINYSKELKEIKVLPKSYLAMGNIYYYMGDLKQAAVMYEKSLPLYKKSGDKSGFSGASMNIGIISYRSGNYEKSLTFYKKALESFSELKDTMSIGNALENIAITLHSQGLLDSALSINKESLELYKKVKDDVKIAASLENLANIYSAKGDIKKSLSLQLKAIAIKEKLNDKRGLGFSFINLASYYGKLNQSEKNYTYVKKALDLFIEIEDNYNIASTHGVLSGVYYSTEEFDKAIEESMISLELNKELNNSKGIAVNYLTLGNIYKKKDDGEKALDYYVKSLAISEEIGDATSIAGLTSNIGVIYYELGEFKKAKIYYEKALKIRKEVGVKAGIIDSYKTLANVNSKLNRYKDAFDYLYLYADGKEELLNENITEQITEMDAKYESDKKEQEIMLLQKDSEIEKTKHEEETRRNNIIIYSAIGFLILVGFIAVVLFRQNAQKKKTNKVLAQQNDEITKQKEEVEHQKHIVDEKNREITDSITYAKRIQEAILPPTKLVKEWLPQSFVLYKPKDIVAGDFYWMEAVGDTVIFAVADCTGHGVPGALVSVVCHNAMNRAVREFKLQEPAKILDKTRELVIETFDKSDEEVNDGMDIALCSYNTKTKQLNYSGANNALYLIKDNELIDYKADKQPIGQYIAHKPFTNHVIELKEGETIYIFSDGYVDQFGGAKGKKLKSKPFKELILSFQDKPMDEQRTILNTAFEDWKGNLEQIDDVCIIGVRV